MTFPKVRPESWARSVAFALASLKANDLAYLIAYDFISLSKVNPLIETPSIVANKSTKVPIFSPLVPKFLTVTVKV
jgi:hypothetical protein